MRAAIFLLLAAAASGQQVITTIAGSDWVFNDDGKPGKQAALASPVAVATDAKGNVYIADAALNSVLKLDDKGIVTIVAGNGIRRTAGDGGLARSALLANPQSMVLDRVGNLYIAEGFGVVRKVTPDGIISTFAGQKQTGYAGDGGPATKALLGNPIAVTVDAAGNVYIRDYFDSRIRKVNTAGIISTYAGTGTAGFSGDNGPATSASIDFAGALATDAQGNLYLAEPDFCRLRKIDAASGIISTIAGTGQCIFSGDTGPARNAQLAAPTGIAFDALGNLYIAEQIGNRIRRVDPNGIISTIAGTGVNGFSGDGGNSAQAVFSSPVSVTVAPSGMLYVADRDNQRVRVFQPGSAISTVAGTGQGVGDGGPASAAHFNSARDLAVDKFGNLYIGDHLNFRVRKVSAGGIITTVAGTGHQSFSPDGSIASLSPITGAQSITVDPQGAVVFGDGNRIRRIRQDGTLQTIAGTGGGGTAGDGGPATSAVVSFPRNMVYDSNGNLYFVNGNIQVRMIAGDGTISRVAGNGQNAFSGDGGPALQAAMTYVAGLGVDSQGNIYIADRFNYRLRKVDRNGIINTVAGTGVCGFAPDGSVAALAAICFSTLGGVVLDRAGNVLFDTNDSVRGLSPAGKLFTYAGSGKFGFFGDGGPALSAAFQDPAGLVFDSQGNLLVTDFENSRVREVLSGPTPIILLSQKGLTFTTTASVPQSQTFTVVNGALGTLNFAATATTNSGGAWLSVSPSSGIAATGAPGVPLTVSVDASKLTPGDYYGQIQITAPGVPNSPQSVTVVLSVASAPPLDITVKPGGLIFTAVAGGPAPSPQSIAISTLSSQTLNFSATQTFGGAQWFDLATKSGTISSTKSATLSVVPNMAGLAPGVYDAKITIAAGTAPIKTVELHLIVSSGAPSGSVITGGLTPAATTCTPSRLIPVVSTLPDGFNLTAAWPIPLEVRVSDDCGNPMLSGSVVASFSTGDPPLSLKSLQSGSWAATWQTRSVTQATISIAARMTSPAITGSTQITGGLLNNKNAPPSIDVGGIVDSASSETHSPIAPGTLISIYGQNLATGNNITLDFPLPIDLNSTEVFMAGRSLPLLFANDRLINAMVPYDLPPNATHQVIVTRGSTISLPEPIEVVPARPGLFSANAQGFGPGIAVGYFADGTAALVDPAHPVHAGEAIVLYATGLGDVDPRVLTGASAPITPLSNSINPATATIGGVPANVFFSGALATYSGVYQVNITVPSGITPGDSVPVVVTQNGVDSPPVTISVR